ncbi:hypothetical protein C1W90_25230 [Burkholderia pseudomallei]|nr:hypothetical protein EGY14_00250 [Burkholderia pseudomallei]MUU86100.1 hypothetical protein [Burkholderia pseudomallei]MVZ86668.1 hypothetical protein [Burkholderia pseudomallei]MWA20483.1 hypothetical protein [Burkholderia pseudomallei]MWA26101.1 hypothetical protein [Burkholderia pseudomallei]
MCSSECFRRGFASIPCWIPTSVSFESPAFDTTNFCTSRNNPMPFLEKVPATAGIASIARA